MSQPHDLQDLDARGAAAGTDLQGRAAARPIPAFDPDRSPTLAVPLPPSAPRRGRSLVAVAAALALLAGAAVWWSVRPDPGGDTADQVITGDPRPHVATDLPAGLELVGALAYEPIAPGEGLVSGPMTLFGPEARTPGLGVVVVDEPGLGGPDESLAPLDVPGFEVVDFGGMGMAPSMIGVIDGDRAVLLLSGTLTTEELAALVPEMEVDETARTAMIGRDSLPDGWTALGQLEDPLLALSPVALFRSQAASPGYATAYTAPTSEGSNEVLSMYLTVSSTSGGEVQAFATGLVTEEPERVTVRGHEAVLGSVRPDGGDDHLTWMVSWVEAPGEVLRVSGMGLSRDEVLAVAEGLEPVGAADWQALLEETRLGGLGPDVGQTVGEGRFADGTRWILRIDDEDSSDSSPSTRLSVDIDRSSGGSSSSSFASVGSAIGEATEPPASILTTTVDEYPRRLFLSGLVAADVAAIEVRTADGTVLGRPDILEGAGHRGFAFELTGDAARLVALAADGSELDAQGIDRPGDTGPDPMCTQVVEDGSTTEDCFAAPEPVLPGQGD